MSKDRRVTRLSDGGVEFKDDLGFELRFQVTIRRELSMPAEKINAPGAPAQRAPNELGVTDDMAALPRSLSHVVLFVPDMDKVVSFFCDRLGFVVTDVLTGAGPFLRPQANDDHHTHFFIRTPAYMQGCEHLAFHMGGPTELMVAGDRFVRKGYQSFWGPGRHKFGSNWFWYFNSPSSCTLNTTPTWTSTMTAGSHAKRRTGQRPARSSCCSGARNGRPAEVPKAVPAHERRPTETLSPR